MAGFLTALMKQRRDAKKAKPDTHGRLKEIIAVLNKYDYKDGITPEITASLLQDLGPTFVKIGQIASQQAEYIPPEYCEALKKLRSKVEPMDVETVHSQIEKHLGKPVDELFASFDDKPLGSASIGQVHKAELADGSVVAVKVRRPGVVNTVARDFALIEKVLDKFSKPDGSGMNLKDMVVELEKTSTIELDFTNEANNLERFWENNTGREGIIIPKCYRELTNEAILTEDFVTGREVSDTAFLDTLDNDERDRIAGLVSDNFAMQILTDGFYHADPHSGNVFIRPDHTVQWIDFGMMGTLTSGQRQTLLDLVTSVVMKDAYKLKRTVMKVALAQGDVDHGALLEMCEGICGQFNGTDLGDFDLGDLIGTVLSGLQGQNFKVDPFLTNLARGVIAMEGTVKTLSPRVNMLDHFVDKIDTGLNFDLSLESLKKKNPEIAMKILKLAQGITDSTTKSAEALDMLEKGQIRVRTDFGFEDRALETVNRLTGYMIRALMIIGLFIGSCLLCTAPAFTSESSAFTIAFPIIGLAGYVVSIFFTYRLYRSMKKSKKN